MCNFRLILNNGDNCSFSSLWTYIWNEQITVCIFKKLVIQIQFFIIIMKSAPLRPIFTERLFHAMTLLWRRQLPLRTTIPSYDLPANFKIHHWDQVCEWYNQAYYHKLKSDGMDKHRDSRINQPSYSFQLKSMPAFRIPVKIEDGVKDWGMDDGSDAFAETQDLPDGFVISRPSVK